MPAFENALMLVADTNDPTEVVPNRYAVTGQASSSGSSSSGSGSGDSSSGSSGDSTSWISGHEIHTYFDQTPGQVTGDIVWRGEFDWGGPGAHYNIIVEYAVNSTMLTGPTSAWGQFSEDPDAVLNAGVNGFSGSPWGTDEFSPHSMWYGAETLKEAGARLDYWRQNFTQWANDVDSNDSDFQGSAAGVFRQTLMSFANMLQALSEQFAAPKFVSQLASLENVMNSNVTTFRNKVDAWMSDSNNSPSTILQNVFENVMSTANVEYGFSASQARVSPHINTSYGDPANDSFWTQVDSVAKQQWLATLGPLDDAAQEFLSALDYAYQQTDAMMPSAFMPPPALTPPGTGDDGTNGGNGGNGGPITLKLSGNDGSTGGSNGNNGNGGNINLSGLNSGNSGGNGNNGGNLDLGGLNGGGLGGGGGNSGGLGGPGNLGNFLTTGGNSGSGGDSNGANLPYLSALNTTGFSGPGNGGGQSQVLGPGGQPLTDGSGGPLTVPSGSSIGPNGSVIGPNGQPV
ncbi:MAG TPA: hypothetical protein VHX38_29270, partial [Pseudonocardiaceae bacterium]|nr:hypothetical protein [Pseudonocardiaceae bacterium]